MIYQTVDIGNQKMIDDAYTGAYGTSFHFMTQMREVESHLYVRTYASIYNQCFGIVAFARRSSLHGAQSILLLT